MIPVIEAFMAAHQLPDVTVVADAGMVSEANQKDIEAAGLSFILGAKIPHVPYAVAQWRREHPGDQIPDGHVFTQPWPAAQASGRRDKTIYYQYRHDRARRTLRGIDEQVAKAEKAVAGQAPVKRNRFVQLSGGTKTVNRELEQKARSLAGIKGYVNQPGRLPRLHARDRGIRDRRLPPAVPDRADFPDGQERSAGQTVYHRKRDPIEAHLTIVFAALAVSRWIEHQTGWSIRKFVRTARRYRVIQIQAGPHVVTAADPLPGELRTALDQIHGRTAAH
jgi:hypothetical protein